MKKDVSSPMPSGAYTDGAIAYGMGDSCECPYTAGTARMRTEWFTGYLDARTADRLKLKTYGRLECCGK